MAREAGPGFPMKEITETKTLIAEHNETSTPSFPLAAFQ